MSEVKDPFAIYHGLYFNKEDGGASGPGAFRVSTLNEKELKCVPNRGAEWKIEKKSHDKFIRTNDQTVYQFTRQSGSGVVISVKEIPVRQRQNRPPASDSADQPLTGLSDVM